MIGADELRSRSPPAPRPAASPRWRQTLAKARTCAVVAADDDDALAEHSRACGSRRAPAMSLTWQTICHDGRMTRAISACEEFGVGIEPAGQAPVGERIGRRGRVGRSAAAGQRDAHRDRSANSDR